RWTRSAGASATRIPRFFGGFSGVRPALPRPHIGSASASPTSPGRGAGNPDNDAEPALPRNRSLDSSHGKRRVLADACFPIQGGSAMSPNNKGLGCLLALSMSALLLPLSVLAQAPPDDKSDELEEAIVTGLRVGQGGAQDINFFRGEVAYARIPHPDSLTAEGLMSEHDIVLPAAKECRQLFCLTGEAARADLIAVPHAQYLAGIGFATNMDERKWHRKPVNLIAVVDKSGSMDGEPLELVRQSLAAMARLMRSGDQLTIVLYGDTAEVYLPTQRVGPANVGPVLRSIEQIESAG